MTHPDRTRACPVCRSAEHDRLYQQRFEDFAAGSITSSYDVVACRACGMCFASGLPDVGRFSEYYSQSSKYDLSADNAQESPFDAERFGKSADFIASNVADHSRPVLDVGTATGALLVALRDRGFPDVHGIEPSEEAARKARDLHGLDVMAGDVGTAASTGLRYDIVCLLMVLEHLLDPVVALRELAALLGPVGVLYLQVPDAARFSEFVNAPFQEFSVEHINYFTPQSFRNLLAAANLEVAIERTTTVKISDESRASVLDVLCRPVAQVPAPTADTDGVERLRRYVARSTEVEAGILQKIDDIADSHRPIYVWGTGTHALHLLASSRLGDCNIVAFIDSNPHYSGRKLAGRPVLSPKQLNEVDAPILVASAVSQSAIASAARKLLGPDVPLILMY